MGFFKNIFGKQEDKPEIEEEKGGETQIFCDFCQKQIAGKPRVKKHQQKTLFFHKGCWKSMIKGQYPST